MARSRLQNPWENDPVVPPSRDPRINEREQAETRYRNTTGDTNPLARPVILPGEEGYAGPAEYLPQAGVAVRRQPWESDPIASDPISGRLEAYSSSATEQLFGLDKVAAFTAGLLTGTPYSEVREIQGELRDYDRQNYAGERDAGGVSGFGATLFAPGAAWVGGATRGAQVARAAAVSGGYSGAQAFTQGEGSFAERLPRAAVAAPVGALGGAALQRGAQAVGGYAQRLGSIAGGSAPASPMAARVADFDRVGVDPMLAGVGGPLTQRTAQTLGGNVMTGGPIIAGATRARDQTISAVDDIASRYGAAPDRDSAGGILRRAAQSGADNYRREGGALYAPINALEEASSRVVSDVGPVQPQTIPLGNAQRAIQENLSVFQTPALRDWFTANATDLSALQGVLQRAEGQATLAEARQLRTIVGRMLDDPEVFRSQSQAGLSRMYGALSDDISEGARTLGGDEAASALSRADTYYSAARTRADDVLRQFYDSTTDAEAYNRLVARAQTTGNRSSWQQIRQLRDSVTPEEWGDIGAGVIRTLGQRGDDFSVSQFATNWEKMTPQARRILFGGSGRTEMFQDLQALARVTQAQQRAGRFYNSSESGNVAGNLAGAGALGGATMAAATGNALPLVTVLGTGAVGNGLSRLLTSPGVARWVAGPVNRAIPDAERLAARNATFAEFWNANREAITRLVAQNDNLASAPGRVAAEDQEQVR
jgi:hypothetical protein